MNKTDKIIIFFYVFLVVSYGGIVIYVDKTYFSGVKFLNEEKQTFNDVLFVETVDVDRKKIFDAMSNIEDYPLILPDNFLSVKIINKTNDVIFAEEEVMESYLKAKMLVKHTLVPYDNQTMEIMSGDAQGTIITETFEKTNSSTKLTTKIKFHVTGKLTPIVYIPPISVQQELHAKITTFVNYAKGFDNKYEKEVDNLYREILFRPADPAGLKYYSLMLQNGKMTTDDIKQALSNSNEAKLVLKPSQRKTPDELDPKTRKIVDDIYKKVLFRSADPGGMSYYGSLLESGKMTADDVKQALYNSDEAAENRIHTKTERELDILYQDIFHKRVDQNTIDHYEPLINSKNMTLDEVKIDLLKNKP